ATAKSVVKRASTSKRKVEKDKARFSGVGGKRVVTTKVKFAGKVISVKETVPSGVGGDQDGGEGIDALLGSLEERKINTLQKTAMEKGEASEQGE
ncbi:hypothetical protein TrRE_jg11787, partial [Triparma retinervis]